MKPFPCQTYPPVGSRLAAVLIPSWLLCVSGTAGPVFYNYDAWNLFYYGADDPGIRSALAPLASNGVTTVMLSPNVGQAFICTPGVHLDMCHSNGTCPSDADLANFARDSGFGSNFVWEAASVVRRWNSESVDAFGIAVAQARSLGLGVFLSFRLNDKHTLDKLPNGPYSDRFWQNHPSYRTSGPTLDFSNDEVRQYRVDQIHELIERYEVDGIELDFLRSEPYFRFDNNAASADLMNDFVFRVATVVTSVSQKTGRPIRVFVRVPSSFAGCLMLGLEPLSWAQNRYVDGIVLARWMRLTSDMDVEEFKRAAPGVPVYGCLEFLISTESGERMSSDEAYRGIGAALYSRGADGLYLYNMYSSRNEGALAHTESFGILSQLADPSVLAYTDRLFLANRLDVGCNGRDQGYEVRHGTSLPTGEDDRPMSGVPLCGSVTNLPTWCKREVAPARFPFESEIYVGSINRAAAHTLRLVGDGIVTAPVIVQVNGKRLGQGTAATTRTLFPEPYNTQAPALADCLDFSVPAEVLFAGRNVIAVHAPGNQSAQWSLDGVELASRVPQQPGPKIVAVSPGGAAVRVTYSGQAGLLYSLQRSTDLLSWTDLGVVIMPTEGVRTFFDQSAPREAAFYRAALRP